MSTYAIPYRLTAHRRAILRAPALTRCVALLFLLLYPHAIQAQTSSVPPLMNYQGKLTKPDGSPVEDGQYKVRFSIHDALTGGTERWFQTMDPVLVRNGVFSVLLGSGNPLSSEVFSGTRYLEIKVGDLAPLSPRQPIVSVGYSFVAQKAEVANTALAVQNGGVGTGGLADNSVTAAKLASDRNSLPKLTSGALSIETGSDDFNVFRNANFAQRIGLGASKPIGYSLASATFPYQGNTVGHYALGWYPDAWSGTEPTSYLSGYGGIKLFSNGLRMSIARNGQIINYGSTYIDNHGFGGDTSIDLAVGDGDTGLKWQGDGNLWWMSDGARRISVERTGQTIFYGPTYIDWHGWGGLPAIDLAIGDQDTGIRWVADGALDVWANGAPRLEIRPDRVTVVNANKQGAVDTLSYGRRAMYSVEAADVRFTDEGTATLKNGYALVQLDPVFLETIEGEHIIHLTPYVKESLYVSKVTPTYFEVRTLSGKGNGSFAWRLSAKRRGFANRRLEAIPPAITPGGKS